MSAARSKRTRGLLFVGLLLVAAGAVFFVAPNLGSLKDWLVRLWPIFLICAGIVRVMGFAVERKPRSPFGGMLLIVIGVLFLASRVEPDLNVLQLYGRYWLLLLGVFAAIELVRYYSHRNSEGAPPRLFTFWRLSVILVIVASGVLANRVATKTSLLSALNLPEFISGVRDSVVGETYPFTDQPVIAPALRPGSKISVSNTYGTVRVSGGANMLRATLSKTVRGWSERDARKIADNIHIVVNETPDGVLITTNRDQVDQQFTTDIQVEVPAAVAVALSNSYGPLSANNLQTNLTVTASYGSAELSNIAGDVVVALNHSDINASNISGNLSIQGAKRARVATLAGNLDLAASNGAVDLREVAGAVRVDAPFCPIVAQGLNETVNLKTDHGSVKLTRAGEVTIQAPHSDVTVETVAGDLKIESSHGHIQLRSIKGDAVIRAEQSSVGADGVDGSIFVQTSHGEVNIRNFSENVHVETSYHNVTLATGIAPAGNIEVENNHGEIKLVVPQGSRFQLDAVSQNGSINSIGLAEVAQKTRDTLTIGADGPKIRLRTSFRRITVQANGGRQIQSRDFVNQTGGEISVNKLGLLPALALLMSGAVSPALC